MGLFGNCGIASIRNLNLKNISIKISYKEKKHYLLALSQAMGAEFQIVMLMVILM